MSINHFTYTTKKSDHFQTLSMSYLAAFVSVSFEIEIILMALIMTTLVTFGIGFIATFSKVLSVVKSYTTYKITEKS